ncbi:hypothetical protein [Streptomyces sp. NPDC093970]
MLDTVGHIKIRREKAFDKRPPDTDLKMIVGFGDDLADRASAGGAS